MKTEFTVDYFIAKFQAIPEDKWCVGDFVNSQGQRCAQGHCLMNAFSNDEAFALWDKSKEVRVLTRILGLWDVALINNGEDLRYQQPTPKLRILAALQDIKAKQDMDDSIRAAKKAVDDFMDFAKEVKALKEPKREIVYVKLEVDLVEANPN